MHVPSVDQAEWDALSVQAAACPDVEIAGAYARWTRVARPHGHSEHQGSSVLMRTLRRHDPQRGPGPDREPR
ncbi:hypothetical protein OG216_00840 [Streptomycetaceae bacterium NBC_01309]